MIVALLKGFISILKGLAVTGRNMLRKPVTVQYPVQKKPMADNFRGMVDLVPEKCIVCMQCVKICPTACLELVPSVNAETKKRTIGSFTFNAELCCFCGLCAEVCPTGAIFMNKCYEAAVFSRKDFIDIDLLNADKYSHFSPSAVHERKK